jgi:hypothetical protein
VFDGVTRIKRPIVRECVVGSVIMARSWLLSRPDDDGQVDRF